MLANSIAILPRFDKNQLVSFTGGIGRIRNYHLELGAWMYLVEMELGPEPETGRIGYETMILLPEIELFLSTETANERAIA